MTMDVEKMRELAARCEAAMEPDRVLDAEIAVALDLPGYGDWPAKRLYELGDSFEEIARSYPHLPKFTASLDAAMTLVPALSYVRLDTWPGGEWGKCHAFVEDLDGPGAGKGMAATGPLALCAAALRALSQEQPNAE